MEEKVEATIYTPTKKTHPRKGKGFSLGEVKGAGLSIHEAKRLGVPIDKRRRTLHPQNVERLKEDFGVVVPLTEIKGIGELAERKLKEADIMDAYDLAHANLSELSKKIKRSSKTLQKWQAEARKLLQKKPIG